MQPAKRRRTWFGVVALIGIALVALNLRTGVAAISPIVREISADIPLTSVQLGVIGMVPPLAFALAGLTGTLIVRRLGLEMYLIVGIAMMVSGHTLRGTAGSFGALLLGSAIALLGMGVGNILVPPLVKKHFGKRVGEVTAIYMTCIQLSATVPALASAPISHAANWRVAMFAWAALAFLSVLPWILLLGRDNDAVRRTQSIAETKPRLRIGRSRVAWAVALTSAVTSFNFFIMFAWLPELLIETAGATSVAAGSLLALYSMIGIPASLLIPVIATRLRSPSKLILLGGALLVSGYLGLLLFGATLTALWVLLLGGGQLLFPLVLILINLRTDTTTGSAALSSFVQGIGYAVAACGPVLAGTLRELSGSWTILCLVLISTTGALIWTASVLRVPRTVERELGTPAT